MGVRFLLGALGAHSSTVEQFPLKESVGGSNPPALTILNMENGQTDAATYIEDESPEITVGENIGWAGKLFNAFPAFKSRNYQLYFGGQLISVIGTWLQIVAEGWLVYQLTHSAFYVGLDAAAATIPSLFLSLLGGMIVDRYPKKRILLFTQTASMILAFTLGILAVLQV